jgi:cyclopropane fatty-acyl-phospholipid synthase-like methyltransferase
VSASSDPFGQHDWHSPEYVEQWVTARTAMAAERTPALRMVVAALPGGAGPSRVLDIGTGWGPLAYEVLSARPHATLVAHDFSAPMLERARRTLAPFAERVEYRMGDLATDGWAEGMPGPFDAVVSAHAIHNVRSHEVIVAVYAAVHRLLAPGGCFVNLDIVDPPGPGAAAAYGRIREGGGGRHGGRHVGDDVAAAGVVDHLRWLTAAGFAEVDCPWKDLRQALLLAIA